MPTTPLPAELTKILAPLEPDCISGLLNCIDRQTIVRTLLDLDARSRALRVLLRAVDNRQKWQRRGEAVADDAR
jgi:hypothetical protein